MTTTVISTVETETSPTVFTGGDLLITGTGGVIDTNGTALVFNVSGIVPDVTINAGAQVYGDDDGIDLNASQGTSSYPAGAFTIDGSVQGNNFGLLLAGTGFAEVVIGAQGAVSGGNGAIFIASSDDVITNYGSISSTFNFGVGATTGAAYVSLTNAGTITGGVNLEASTGVNYVTNSGLIDGAVILPGSAIVSNSGTIDGPVVDYGTSGTSLTNSGSIIGQVNFGSSSAVVDTGSISDGVAFGSGSSLLIGTQGSVTCADGIGIYAGTNCTITNHGLIGAASDFIGISENSDSSAITLTNTGIIDSGVLFTQSSDDTITNSGTISGGLYLGESDHVYNTGTMLNGVAGDGKAYIENDGTISGGINLTAVGRDFVASSGKISGSVILGQIDTLDNSGTVTGGIVGDGNDGITNSGIITGGISDSDTRDTIDNQGTITGTISETGATLTNSGAIHGAVDFSGTNTLDNAGTITGTVTFGGTNDTITNDGTIHGNLDLGVGDVLNTSTGVVTGEIVAADSDTFDFSGSFGHETIASFVATSNSHDTISFSSNDFANYAAVQADMVQVGADVVITLNSGDSIVLLHQTLAHLVSHDFAFT
jgi:hypothetical protein